MNKYLNPVGCADYDLPGLTGKTSQVSSNRNPPAYTLPSKTKLSWFPYRHVEFAGSDAPPSTKYKLLQPEKVKDFHNYEYSVGKDARFKIPSS